MKGSWGQAEHICTLLCDKVCFFLRRGEGHFLGTWTGGGAPEKESDRKIPETCCVPSQLIYRDGSYKSNRKGFVLWKRREEEMEKTCRPSLTGKSPRCHELIAGGGVRTQAGFAE